MNSLFWHDYETSGTDPARDRPLQFAGLRTDPDLQPLGDPVRLYCQPDPLLLPHPAACLITGISPQRARREGARFESGPRTAARPCDPDDIYLAVRALHRRGDLLAAHLRTLARYGALERTPDSRLAEERPHLRLWSEALDRLGDHLRAKGNVE